MLSFVEILKFRNPVLVWRNMLCTGRYFFRIKPSQFHTNHGRKCVVQTHQVCLVDWYFFMDDGLVRILPQNTATNVGIQLGGDYAVRF